MASEKYLFFCIVSLTALPAGTAQAAIYTVSIQGTVFTGTLYQNSFGLSAGSDPSGLSYTSVYTINDNLVPSEPVLPGQEPYLYTSTESRAQSTSNIYPVSASFFLNGMRADLAAGSVFRDKYTSIGLINASAFTVSLSAGDIAYNLYDTIVAPSLSNSADYRAPGVHVDPIQPFLYDSYYTGFGNIKGHDANGTSRFLMYIEAKSVSISSITAGVPEPASWALMIGGFGLVGAMMRRRNRVSSLRVIYA